MDFSRGPSSEQDSWAMVQPGSVVNHDEMQVEEESAGAMQVEEESAGARGSADSERPVSVSQVDEEDFAGASCAARSVRAPAAKFRCDFCSTLYAWISDIAQVEVHGVQLHFHRRSDTTRTLQALNLVAQHAHYTGVTQLKDICFRCAGRRMWADEDRYVDLAKSEDDVKGQALLEAHIRRKPQRPRPGKGR